MEDTTMKKILFPAVAAVILSTAIISCTKEIESVAPVPQTVTLTATIGDPASKITYTEESGLKGSWDAEEAITVVSIFNGKALSYDTFTSTGAAGRRTAEFTGTITSTGATSYVCYYPAMSVTTDDSYAYRSKLLQHGSQSYPLLYIDKQSSGGFYMDFDNCYQMQAANGDFSFISERSVLRGIATIQDGSLDVKMENLLSVFRYELTVPESLKGNNVQNVRISVRKPDGGFCSFCAEEGWGYVDGSGFAVGGSSSRLDTFLGGWANTTSYDVKGFAVPDDCKVIAYASFYPKSETIPENGSMIISLLTDSEVLLARKTFTFKNNVQLQSGKLYNIKADMELAQ